MPESRLLRWLAQCRHQDSTTLQELPGAITGIPVDQIKNHIEILCQILEALGLVVDDDVRAESTSKLHISRYHCRQYSCSLGLGELDSKMADATRAAMD